MNYDSAKLSKYAFIGLLFFSTSIISNSIFAEQSPKALHSHQNIKQTTHDFLRKNVDATRYSRVEMQVGNLDSRLRLAKCNVPLDASLAPGSQFSGKTTVHVRCNSNTPWTVYIGAHIKLYSRVIQTAVPLDRNHILKKHDLIAVETDLTRLKFGYFTDKKNLIGKQVKQRLPQNRVIKANYVKAPTLVKRGELVSIITENSRYSVKMTGTAMGSGARGDKIRVKNTSSKRVIEGTIKESGVVSIN